MVLTAFFRIKHIMKYSRSLLQDDEKRRDIAEELLNKQWKMTVTRVEETYAFLSHPDFPDHVFCSNSVIPHRPILLGDKLVTEIKIIFDPARQSYSYVCDYACKPQDNLRTPLHKSEYENLAAKLNSILAKANSDISPEAWDKILPSYCPWTPAFCLRNKDQIKTVINKLTQCGSLIRLHGVPNGKAVEEIREVLRSDQRFEPLAQLFENILENVHRNIIAKQNN